MPFVRTDFRNLQSPIRDQGCRGTCVAFAFTSGHEVVCADGVDLCEEFLHWAAKQQDGLACMSVGTTLAAAASVLRGIGQPPEHSWPYDDSHDVTSADYKPSKQACQLALQRKLSSGQAFQPTVDTVHAAMVTSNVVVLGLQLFSTWHLVPGSGFISMPIPSDPVLSGHAVVVVGSASDHTHGDHFIIRNSWGEHWGLKGYGYLPSAYVENYGLEAWSLGRFQK